MTSISSHNHPNKDNSIQRMQMVPLLLSHQKNLDHPLYTAQTANQSNLPRLSAHPSTQKFCAILLTNKLTHQEGMQTTWGIHLFLQTHLSITYMIIWRLMISRPWRKPSLFCSAQSQFKHSCHCFIQMINCKLIEFLLSSSLINGLVTTSLVQCDKVQSLM